MRATTRNDPFQFVFFELEVRRHGFQLRKQRGDVRNAVVVSFLGRQT
jgi:hypothetical protein